MLSKALALADELHATLVGEVERARAEREVLRSLDPDRIFTRAAERAAFNAEVARLEGQLADALRHAAAGLGLEPLTLPRLAARAPGAAAHLGRTLAGIRDLGHELGRLDHLNRTLAGRALACVQGYLTALNPAPSAYDRRGVRAPSSGRPSTTSRKV